MEKPKLLRTKKTRTLSLDCVCQCDQTATTKWLMTLAARPALAPARAPSRAVALALRRVVASAVAAPAPPSRARPPPGRNACTLVNLIGFFFDFSKNLGP